MFDLLILMILMIKPVDSDVIFENEGRQYMKRDEVLPTIPITGVSEQINLMCKLKK